MNMMNEIYGRPSSNASLWLDLQIKHQDINPSDDHQGGVPYWFWVTLVPVYELVNSLTPERDVAMI